MRIVDLFARLLADDTGFEADVVRKSQKAGDAAGAAMGKSIAGGISRGANQIGSALGAIGQNLTKTGRSMTTNLTLPIVAAGGAVAHFALDFDTSLRQIGGLTDVTGDELDGIREKILAMGPAVGKGPQELVDAFYFIASAGFKADEAMEVLETSAKAAAAGLGETKTIAQVLGGVINAYGRENIDAATAADILTEAVSQGTAEASGLASVIGNVVPGAAALGVSFDQVTAAMAGMTLTGVGVEESATSLIQIFSSLQKPTVQAEAALKEMGLSSAELRRQLREEGLLSTLRTLEERFAGNETAAAAVFGNIRALRGVTALLTLDSEQLNAVFAKVADSTGRMQQAYDETEGPARDLARSMADIQATAIQLGQDVLPIAVSVLKQIAGAARELGKWWRSLDADTRKQIVTWLAWVAVAGPALILVGKLATGLGALFKIVGFLAGAKGLPALVKTVKTYITWSATGINATESWTKSLGLLAIAILGAQQAWDPDWRENRADTRAFDDLTDRLNLTGEAAQSVADVDFREFDRKASESFRHVGDAARAMSLETDLIAAGIPAELAAELAGGADEVGAGAEEMVDPVAEALQKAVEDAATRGQEIIDALAGSLADGPDQIRDEMQAIIDALADPYTEVERRVDLEVQLANQAIIDALKSGDPKIEAEAFNQVQHWLAQYELIEPGALAAGELVNPALQDGINSNLAAALSWVQTNVTGPFSDKFKLAAVLEEMGFHNLAEYARGVERGDRLKARVAVGNAANAARLKFGTGYFAEGLNAVDTYARGIQAGADRQLVSRAAANVAKQARDMLRVYSEPKDPRSPLRGITRWGGGMVQTIAEGLVRGVADLNPALARVGQAIADGMNPQRILGGFIEALRGAGALETPDNESHPHRAERLAREVVQLRDLLGLKQTGHGFAGESAHAREERLAQEAIKLRALAKEAGVSLTEAGSGFVDTLREGFKVIQDDFIRLFPPHPLGGLVPSLLPAGGTGLASAGASIVNYNLTVNGVPYTFRTRDDFIRALDDLAGFGGDGRVTPDG